MNDIKNDQPQLLKGWVWTTIADFVGKEGIFIDGDWVESKDQNPAGDVRLIQLADVGDGIYRNKSNRFLNSSKATELGCTYLKSGDVLIARMPDPLGRACIFPGDKKPCITVVDVCIVRTGLGIENHKWFVNAINSPVFRALIDNLQSGSTRKRISRGNLSKIKFSLPPLPEQQRIVAKIEELFSHLDAGVAALKQTKIHLKHYRQSVLKAAVEGKLTEKWRQEHGDRIEPASVLLEKIASRQDAKDAKKRTMPPIDTRNLPEIPEGWVWTRMIDVSKKITDGEHLRPRMLSEGVAFLSAKDVRDDRIIFEEKLFVSQTDALKYRQRCNPVRDDILLVSRGATVGRTSIVNTDRIFCLLGSVILIKPSVIILPKYLSLILKTPSIQKNLIELSGSTAQQAIYIRDLQNQPIPFPPLVEQEQIVAEVERRLSVADELEKTVGTALKQAERLRQSILKRAFEGKLVLQDPNDPPAIELLEWIKAEKKKRND